MTLSSLTEAEQEAAYFTLRRSPKDCCLLRLVIKQGEHLPNSRPEGLEVASGQRDARHLRKKCSQSRHVGCNAEKPRGGWTPRAWDRQRGRALWWQKSRGGIQLPYPVCPTFTMDVSEQRGNVCSQVVYVWVHAIIPTEYLGGVGLLVSF